MNPHQEMLAQLGALHDDMIQLPAEIRTALQEAEDGFDALATNLRGVVNDQMDFRGTVDPDEPNPSNEDGGTFSSINDLINAAPMGAQVTGSLIEGKTYDIPTDNFRVFTRDVILSRLGIGANPIIAPSAFAADGYNYPYAARITSGSLRLVNVDIAMPIKPDPALPWGRETFVNYSGSNPFFRMYGGTFTGQDGQALISSHIASICAVSLQNVTLDGDVFAVRHTNYGAGNFAERGCALANGAAWFDAIPANNWTYKAGGM